MYVSKAYPVISTFTEDGWLHGSFGFVNLTFSHHFWSPNEMEFKTTQH